MDDTLDAWSNLACAVVRRAMLDIRQPSAREYWKLDARLFLFYDQRAEWFMESMGLDVERVRTRLRTLT